MRGSGHDVVPPILFCQRGHHENEGQGTRTGSTSEASREDESVQNSRAAEISLTQVSVHSRGGGQRHHSPLGVVIAQGTRRERRR